MFLKNFTFGEGWIIAQVLVCALLYPGYRLFDHLRNRYFRYRKGYDVTIPFSETKRPGIFFGYYGCFENQVEETKDHTNFIWSIQFEGPDGVIKNMKDSGHKTVVDVGFQLTKRNESGKVVMKDYGEAFVNLHNFFTKMKAEGVIHNLYGVTPGDEPNSQFENINVWHKAVEIIHEVADNFEELKDLKIMMLLNGAANNDELKSWVPFADCVGFDIYKKKSAILEPKTWIHPGGLQVQLESWLTEEQKTFLVPGGHDNQTPWPFAYYAQHNPKVMAIVCFLWASVNDGKEDLRGIRDNSETKVQYVAAGRYITHE